MSNQTKRNYTQEFKQEAVKLVTEQGYKVSEAARNLGLSRSMLGRWRRGSSMPRKPESGWVGKSGKS
jgi:transposase